MRANITFPIPTMARTFRFSSAERAISPSSGSGRAAVWRAQVSGSLVLRAWITILLRRAHSTA